MTVVYGELPRLLLSTVGSPWIVKFGLVWVFKMPFNFVVVGVLTDSARLEPSIYAKMSLSVPCVAELLQGNQGGLGLLFTRHRGYCKPGRIREGVKNMFTEYVRKGGRVTEMYRNI